MSDIEKIQGRDILRLFRELQNDSALLKVYLPENDFKYLTRITDIQTRKRIAYFEIDYPEGDHDPAKFSNAGSMEFEFTGNDEVKYAFRSAAEKIFTEKIWLQLPSVVEREQRRRQFRISAPLGSMLRFKLISTDYELKVIDISLGGSLGVLAGASKKNSKDLNRLQTKTVEDLELYFPTENEHILVTIKNAELKRFKRNPRTNQYEYALEFKTMDSFNKKRLNDLIYRFQREFLRKRLRVNA
jgi:c-di-GMP-binding flagellar brake protein YcgR